MPNITIALTAKDWARALPAARSAYGPSIDPAGQLPDDQLIVQVLRRHVQSLVKDHEKAKAEAAIVIPDLE